MALSNIEYSVLKKRKGLHNRGFLTAKGENEMDTANLEDAETQEFYSPELLHQNDFGEYYALQDFEE